jgi:hypothetical protein
VFAAKEGEAGACLIITNVPTTVTAIAADERIRSSVSLFME